MPKEVWIDTDEWYPCYSVRKVDDWLRRDYPEEIALVDEETLLRWATIRDAFFETQQEMSNILKENRRKKEQQQKEPFSTDTPE